MRRPALICLVVAALSAALLLGGHGVVLLAGLPTVLLLATLACGRYVGEDVLDRIRVGVRRRRRRTAAPRTKTPVRSRHDALLTSMLLAFGRGVRGPPAVPAAR